MCKGNQCCMDGSICPSAAEGFAACNTGKREDCTKPRKVFKCQVGEEVPCPGTKSFCRGDQCCSDGTTCPSARASFKACDIGKTEDCTWAVLQQPQPKKRQGTTAESKQEAAEPRRAAPRCRVGDKVTCPGSHRHCSGDECCPDGSTCPSARNGGSQVCPEVKRVDCTKGGLLLHS